VEAVFEGDEQAVDQMVEWCRTGPSLARVDKIELQQEPPTGARQFRITR
jgi:acylphosphatase